MDFEKIGTTVLLVWIIGWLVVDAVLGGIALMTGHPVWAVYLLILAVVNAMILPQAIDNYHYFHRQSD